MPLSGGFTGKFPANNAISFGANTVWNMSVQGGSPYSVVIESITPNYLSNKIEFPNGDGTVYGVIYTNCRATISISLYLLTTTVILAKSNNESLTIFPGHKITFAVRSGGDAFGMLTGNTWRADTFSKTRQFGERAMMNFTATSYPLVG